MENTANIIFVMHKQRRSVELEIPLSISANELVVVLNNVYDLGIDTTNAKQCFFQADNPIALLKGSKLLCDYGVRNGTTIHCTV